MNAPLFIGYGSAVYRLFHCGMRGLRKSRAIPLPGDSPGAKRAVEARRLAGLPDDSRVDVCVVRDRDKRKGAAIRSRKCAWAGDGDYLSLGNDIYIACPELAFLQSAETLSVPELAFLGLELCGAYVSRDGAFERNRPPTCREALAEYLDRHAGVRGVGKAREALEFVVDGSASPRESQCVALLCLPQRFGGYGFKLPQVNAKVNLNAGQRRMLGKSYLRCDLLWEERMLAIEYDSDSCHSGAEKINDDSLRRNVLRTIGITVIDVTNAQIKSAEAFHGIAVQVERLLGCRVLARRTSAWRGKNRALRDALLRGDVCQLAAAENGVATP